MEPGKYIEQLSEAVHNSWMKEKLDQGFHAPNDCPTNGMAQQYSNLQKFGKFDKHCDKCHIDLYPYVELPENIKEYSRVTVKTVLDAINLLESAKCKDCYYLENGVCLGFETDFEQEEDGEICETFNFKEV